MTAPDNFGILTDKEETGFPGCRILVDGEQADRHFTVLPFVQKYLDNIPKKARVCFQTKDGKISKVWEDKPVGTPEVPSKSPSSTPEVNPSNSGELKTDVAVPMQQSQQVAIAGQYSNDEVLLIRNIAAKNCTEPEFKLLMYMARTYGLDPLLKQIWAVKRNDRDPALIFAGRDGMLAVAHRSGQLDGMQSGVIYEGEGKDHKPVSAWCEIWRKDMSHSFKAEVPFSEYNTGFSVWKTNPSAMILKVAESVCLRKAFSIAGIYCPEEINTEVRNE